MNNRRIAEQEALLADPAHKPVDTGSACCDGDHAAAMANAHGMGQESARQPAEVERLRTLLEEGVRLVEKFYELDLCARFRTDSEADNRIGPCGACKRRSTRPAREGGEG